MHAHASIMAMRLGKHCYTEKPLTHDASEARLMKETAQKHKVATQMGNQGTAGDNFRRAVETVQAGALGEVREVHVWTNERSRPPEKLLMGQKLRQSGSLIIGSRGTLYTSDDYGNNNTLLPLEQFKNYEPPKPTLPRVNRAHHREWLDAIRGGRPAMSNF